MGKKSKDKKKGKGAEKTAARTDKKIVNKQKKELEAIGEDDIESILAQIEHEEQKRLKVTEHIVELPSRRIHFTFVPHPDKDELILYGGEYCNGQKTFVYGDLFFYNISNNTWTLVKVPKSPQPRCGHQMIATSANKGQLWVFGGEYASPSQSQFYHYKDLWVYHIANKQWERITSPNGPSARSGHRMIYSKKQLIVFGGYNDNLRNYKYFNDIYSFNTETYKWLKLEPTGTAPAPRSACSMVPLPDGRILIYGGYSKVKVTKDQDKGQVFLDAFLLVPDKNDTTGTKFKWVSTKLGGTHFSPRSNMPITVAPNNQSYSFGGVLDKEDDDDLSGSFYNDLFGLDLEKLTWRSITVTGKKDKENKPRRKKQDGENLEDDAENSVNEIKEQLESTTVSDDGVFKVIVGPAPVSSTSTASGIETEKIFQPSPRINCGLAVKHGVLYLYGGRCEDGDREITLQDFYALDLKKLDEWRTIIKDDLDKSEWLESEDSEDENEDEDQDEEEDEDEGSDEDDNEDSDENKDAGPNC